ncbi:MAG: Hpt domain-containing protein [Hydrogenophaga sp.]
MPSHTGLDSSIDADCLAALGGPHGLFRRLAVVFIEQSGRWLTAFETAIQHDAPEPVLDLLHQMKGSCGAIGATALARAMGEAEQAVKSQGLPASRTVLRTLCAQLRHLSQVLGQGTACGTFSPEDP